MSGTRETIIRAVKLFCNNNKKISIADNGEQELIFINKNSVNFEFISYEFDLNCEPENFNFELLITVWGEVRTDSLLTNQIREFIKSLSAEVNRVLELKKAIEKSNRQEEKARKGAEKVEVNQDELIENAYLFYMGEVA